MCSSDLVAKKQSVEDRRSTLLCLTKKGQQLYPEILPTVNEFAGYGFNKSHSAAYALVSYQTAWLKAHYPGPFMAAVWSITKTLSINS